MKKIISILLVTILVLIGVFCAYALAEAAEPATPTAPLVDLTGVIVAVLALVFDFLLAWIAKAIIPPIKTWLATYTTEKQRGLLWDAVCKLVDAAEQLITGEKMGKKRKAYVEAGLQQRGLTIDTDMIETAVKRMKERAMYAVGETFDIENVATLDLDDDGEPDLDITHWSLAQFKTFFKLNNFDDTGFSTREEYVDYLSNPPA